MSSPERPSLEIYPHESGSYYIRLDPKDFKVGALKRILTLNIFSVEKPQISIIDQNKNTHEISPENLNKAQLLTKKQRKIFVKRCADIMSAARSIFIERANITEASVILFKPLTKNELQWNRNWTDKKMNMTKGLFFAHPVIAERVSLSHN